MPFFNNTKTLVNKTEKGENIPSLAVVKSVLVQCNLVDNQYQQKFDALYFFTSKKSYAYLLNVEQNNLAFLKTYNTGFGEIILKCAHQNSTPLEKKYEVNFTLLTDK